MRSRRGHDPHLRHDTLTAPGSAVEVQLPQLQQIAASQLQAAAGHRGAGRRVLPFNTLDPEGPEQVFGREVGHGRAGCAFERAAERHRARGAVAEAAAVVGVLGFRRPGWETLDRKVQRELDPVLDQVHPLLVAA